VRCSDLAELPAPPPDKAGWPWIADGAAQCSRTRPDSYTWPCISIVTPSYNQGQFIEETIRSVLLQGYPNLEYIIRDGGSTDGSVDIIKKYEPWLTCWTSEQDGGQADAINKGFSACTGELLGFINSDDLYARGALQAIVATWTSAGRPRNALVCGRVKDIDAAGVPLPQMFEPIKLGTLNEWLTWGISIHQPGCFWTAETWRRFGPLPSNFHYIFDRYFFLKIAAQGESAFVISNSLISFFRMHPNSKSGSKSAEFSQEWEAAVDRLRTDVPFRHRMVIDFVKWKKRNSDFASKVLSETDVQAARRLLIRHMMCDPVSIFLRPILGATRRLMLHSNLREWG